MELWKMTQNLAAAALISFLEGIVAASMVISAILATPATSGRLQRAVQASPGPASSITIVHK
jgi:hypothetical protein